MPRLLPSIPHSHYSDLKGLELSPLTVSLRLNQRCLPLNHQASLAQATELSVAKVLDTFIDAPPVSCLTCSSEFSFQHPFLQDLTIDIKELLQTNL